MLPQAAVTPSAQITQKRNPETAPTETAPPQKARTLPRRLGPGRPRSHRPGAVQHFGTAGLWQPNRRTGTHSNQKARARLMARQVFRTWEDYFIPGTSVLRNKFTTPGNPYGEPDAVKLRLLEEGYASSRILELSQTPIKGNFDYAHMKAIHHHISKISMSGQARSGLLPWARSCQVWPRRCPLPAGRSGCATNVLPVLSSRPSLRAGSQ